MNVKLMFGNIINAMLQDHVGPHEILKNINEISSEISNSIGLHFWSHGCPKIENSQDENAIKEFNTHFIAFKNNIKIAGFDETMIRSHLLVDVTKSIIESKLSEEQFIEICRTVYKNNNKE